jgi:hypothetical protein
MYALFRLAAVCTTVFLFLQVGERALWSITVAVGLAHYLLAFIYSRSAIEANYVDVFHRNRTKGFVFAGILAGSIVLGLFYPSIVFIFGLHHVFSDLYLFRDPKTDSPATEATLLPRLLLNTVGYLTMVMPEQVSLMRYYVVGGAVAVYLLLSLGNLAANGEKKRAANLLAFELVGVAFVLFARTTGFGFRLSILYHFILWIFISLQRSKGWRLRHALEHASATSLMFFAVPIMPVALISFYRPNNWLNFFGYIHIVMSFFISKLNPKPLVELQERSSVKEAA